MKGIVLGDYLFPLAYNQKRQALSGDYGLKSDALPHHYHQSFEDEGIEVMEKIAKLVVNSCNPTIFSSPN